MKISLFLLISLIFISKSIAGFKQDTSEIHKIIKQSESYWQRNNDSSIFYAKKALNFSRKIKYENGIAEAYLCMGITYLFEGKYEKTAKLLKQSEKLFLKVKNHKGVINVYNAWGGYYYFQGQPEKSIEAYFTCMKYADTLGNSKMKATYLNNIGGTFYQMRKYEKALDYFEQGLIFYKEAKDEGGIAFTINNIGNVKYSLNQFSEAKENYLIAMEYYEKNNSPYRQSGIYNNLGFIYRAEKNYQIATDYILKSIKIREEIGDQAGLASCYSNLASVYIEQGKFSEGINYSKKGLEIANNIHANELKKDILHFMAMGYAGNGNYKIAYETLDLFVSIKDSLINSENQRNITDMETKYETDKKALEIKNLKNEKEIDKLKIKKEAAEKKILEEESAAQKQKIVLFSVGLIIVAFLSILLFRANRNKKRANTELALKNDLIEKQNIEVIHQKELVEEKNKEILDSITYAKRLQDAILPPLKVVKEFLPNSFILYKPKDIVAGDFYFMETLSNKIIIAAADCTGHGVPGAMVSVVCSNALNRAVKEFKLNDAGQILDKVRQLVLETFEKSESEVKDGMDISLCVLDLTNLSLHWSGANNPLWLIHNNELIEFKPDKQPIGKSYEPHPFTTHQISLVKSDTFYIFTDGYEDQFGGEKGKKFKSAKMKELFLSIQINSMEEQRQQINESFEKWRGELEQVDDVCVIGIRI